MSPGRHARRHGRQWTAEEDRVVLEAEAGDLRRVAVLLGRTHTAVVERRQNLRRRQRALIVTIPLHAPVWIASGAG